MESMTEKAQYFGQYFGQEVFKSFYKQVNAIFCKPTDADNYPDSFLELTPLSAITDEDYTEIMFKKYPYQPWVSIKRDNLLPEHFNQEQVDYLRSKSYALPWRDKSVEQLIHLRWLKLKA